MGSNLGDQTKIFQNETAWVRFLTDNVWTIPKLMLTSILIPTVTYVLMLNCCQFMTIWLTTGIDRIYWICSTWDKTLAWHTPTSGDGFDPVNSLLCSITSPSLCQEHQSFLRGLYPSSALIINEISVQMGTGVSNKARPLSFFYFKIKHELVLIWNRPKLEALRSSPQRNRSEASQFRPNNNKALIISWNSRI